MTKARAEQIAQRIVRTLPDLPPRDIMDMAQFRVLHGRFRHADYELERPGDADKILAAVYEIVHRR